MKKLVLKLKIIYSIYIALLLALSLTGCSSSKKLEKSKIDFSVASNTNVTKKTDEAQSGNITDKSEKSQDKKSESTENKSKIKETKVTDYDPSKPIVPGTGKPPVARETVTTEREDTKKSDKTTELLNQKLNLQIDYIKELKQSIDSQNSVISKLKSKEEKKVTVNNWWKWCIAGLVFGAGITILIYQFKWYEIAWNIIQKVLSFLKGKKR